MSDWANLERFAKKIYSQCGEEGIYERIFALIGTSHRVSVEFGCGDGFSLSNTRWLKTHNWTAHMWDSAYESDEVKKHLITVDNINEIFKSYDIPVDFDLLSLDIDGNDYWVWKALTWQPRVVIVEFNGTIAQHKKVTIPYDPTFQHDGTDYYGASFELLCDLGREKGYVPVCQLVDQNLFFVRADLVPPDEVPRLSYTPRQYHPPDSLKRPWQEIP